MFFGHRKINGIKKIKDILKEVLHDLINNHDATMFYVGNNGEFDMLVKKTLKELKTEYPHINYAVVLAYMPGEKKNSDNENDTDTIFPEELAKTPRRFAIVKRNQWMIERSDTVVTYVTDSFGGAAKFKESAEKKKLRTINLPEINK